ncbi:Utp14-domain-containing protein [Lojkania enalia]|uniref:Utp14-domain-containing protein n=1 Tax=Lojkania enalia TaxID=147567 RepID=A0A9P4K537_9PLEO|nr:Utp14-domain-containing protein [Didymosphaeria enalia]
MPTRISRSSVPNAQARTKKTSKPKKTQERALNAFAIAEQEHPDRPKIRQHRLGESDLTSRRKRTRDINEDEGGSDDKPTEKRRRQKPYNEDDMSIDEGSDSEGHQWTMGHVDDDDDESIDSDEAFGESDKERFEGMVFQGNSSKHQGGKKGATKRRSLDDEDENIRGDIDLDEGESADEEEDGDTLGEDAIDLATALDQYEESKEERLKDSKKKQKLEDSDSELSEEEGLAAEGADDIDSDEDDEEADKDKMKQLNRLISCLPGDAEVLSTGTRKVDVHESATPSEFGVFRKVNLLALNPKFTDPERRKSLKLLQDDSKPTKRNDIARKLDVPLPKRQQDKLDRAAAKTKANETLGRWVDTVKQNRRAEHLTFPLQHPHAGKSMGESRLLPMTTTAPTNDLESAIQSILQQSGLSNGKDDDEQFQKWEVLGTNKLPLEEVAKRRAQLRRERDLMFREEVRAKRIKKIKSKSYRRVHRKERERMIQREKDALRADGVDVSEDEREYNDRRRAEERIGAKHRQSKWAKGVKKSGRAVWDEEARAGVTEMARRNEELRRRMEGKEVRNEDEGGSDFSSEEDEDEDVNSEEDGNEVLQRQLGHLEKNPFSNDNSKLGNMAFMKKADAAMKARNDEDIERMRRELAGEETPSETENENATRVGRRNFGPSDKIAAPAVLLNRSEFEERPGSNEDDEDYSGHSEQSTNDNPNRFKSSQRSSSGKKEAAANNPYLIKPSKEKQSDKDSQSVLWKAHDTIEALQEKPKASKTKSKPKTSLDNEILEPIISAPDSDGWQTVTYDHDDEGEGEDNVKNGGIDLGDVILRNQALTAKAFADDDVEPEFVAEKKATMEDESSKTITNTLPGWGAWTGEGLSTIARKRKGRHTVKTINGIDPSKRKDAKLDRVIINEKRVKRNTKFLATSLPFPFETKGQYERSLRLPKGREWATKQTFQDATKPRVIIKQGIIQPMSKPMV